MNDFHAYAAPRGKGRSTARITHHAVHFLAHLSGALDTECGATVAIRIGPWDPTHPKACRTCARNAACATEKTIRDVIQGATR